MKNKKYRLIDLYANTRFCLSKLDLLGLFEESSEGREGLELSLFQILTNPDKAELYESSLRIDASILARNDDTGYIRQDEVQDEITDFIKDLKELVHKHRELFYKGKPLYIGLKKPNTIILGIVLEEHP